ncbi:DUF1403 family protein [Rhodobacteraceae bacterium]|nr:DUF1403 family protein [Paracoccaceae bacterium]
MTYQPATLTNDLNTLPKLPAWVTVGSAETPETVAFRSGAALTVLDQLITDPRHGVPIKLLANRLALKAATATSKLEGRMAREADIRDAYHLTPPSDVRGPDGDLLGFCRDAARLRLNAREWQAGLRSLIGHDAETDVHTWLNAGFARARKHGPLAGCAFVMRCVLEADDRAERVACLLSDVVLARTLNWPSLLPITGQHLTKAVLRDLIADGQGVEVKVQQRLLQSVEDTIQISRELARRAAALQVVVPKLRAKGSNAAVDLFFSEDAVAPSMMLSPMIRGTTIPMTDRAARRFCDRLVELGVAQELTGRPTFRLYGIAP